MFNVFLRELYRNAILDSEDRFADEKEAIPKVDSYCVKVRFVMLLWKMNLIVFHVGTESVVTTLVERHISHFVDYCPSLEFGTLTQVRFMEADES